MTIPKKIHDLANLGLESMRQQRRNHFDWRVRRDIYRELKQVDPLIGKQVHGWIAVLSAEHVLPIFTSAIQDDDLPRRLLSMAEALVTGKEKIPKSEVKTLLDEGYHGTGLDAVDWRGFLIYNAEYAGHACYKALLEASGHQGLLDNIGEIREGFLWDEEFAYLAAYGDTAGSAAMASAFGSSKNEFSNEKLKDFWEWWAHSTIDEAWSRAH